MACMCGDTYCYSCGPAQGNAFCRDCRVWYSDGGCEHIGKPVVCDKCGDQIDWPNLDTYAGTKYCEKCETVEVKMEITLRYNRNTERHPRTWAWYDLLDKSADDILSVVTIAEKDIF